VFHSVQVTIKIAGKNMKELNSLRRARQTWRLHLTTATLTLAHIFSAVRIFDLTLFRTFIRML